MIKVAIDSGPLTGGHAIRGVGTYTTFLIKYLRKIKGLEWDVAMFPKGPSGIRGFGTGGSGYSIHRPGQ